MSENQARLSQTGREIFGADWDDNGATAGLAVSRVLQQLYEMAPYDGSNVAKGVLARDGGIVIPDPAGAGTLGDSGAILVKPFRALVGSRTTAGANHLENERDVRSGLFVGTNSDNSTHIEMVGDPLDTNPRIALVYATVTPDSPSTSVSRYMKDATSGVVSIVNVPTTLSTTVTVNVVYGTATGSPIAPTIPADSGGSYNIPLAYVWVPNFSASTGFTLVHMVEDIAPLLFASPGSSSVSMRTARFNYDASLWANSLGTSKGLTSGGRQQTFIPRTMGGVESIQLAIDVLSASSASWNIATGQVVDDTIDWRNRTFVINACAQGASSPGSTTFAWGVANTDTTSTHNLVPCRLGGSTAGAQSTVIMSQSMTNDSVGGIGVTGPLIAVLDNSRMSSVDVGGYLALWVDPSTGALKVAVSGTPKVMYYIWVQASGQMSNR